MHFVHDAKTDALEDLIEELSGTPALVAYEHKHDLSRLLKRFPDAPFIAGGVKKSRFQEIERLWNAGRIPVLFAQPQSVSHGLNLQGTKGAIVWHSQTYNLEDYEQFIRRVYRQGQTDRVFCYHLVAKKTIDDLIIQVLRTKDTTQQKFLNALKAHYSRKIS